MASRFLRSPINALRSALATFVFKGWRESWASGSEAGYGKTSELTQPFKNSPWVHAAVTLVSAPISALPLKFAVGDEDAPQDAGRDEFWSRPSLGRGGRMSLVEFLEASANWLQLEGECFWLLDDTWMGRSTTVRSPLILARPRNMRHIVRGGELIAWEHTDGDGVRHTYLPQDVIQTKGFNPYCDFRGFGPLECARIAADADYAAGLFSKHLAQSNGDRGAYIIAKDGQLTEIQVNQLESRLREKRLLNERGVYKTAVLNGNVTVEDPKIQSADAAFIDGRKENRIEIFVAFGVPANMADKTESTAVGGASDRFRLREDTCLPLSVKLMESVEQVEARRSGARFKVTQDWSLDPVMQSARNERVEKAVAAWKCGVPWSALNNLFSLGLEEFPGSDVAWLPLNLQPADVPGNGKASGVKPSSSGAPQVDPSPPPSKIADGASAIERLLTAPATRAQEDITARDSEDAKRNALWEHNMAVRAKSEKAWLVQLRKVLVEARKETLANLDHADSNKAVRVPGVLDIVFDLARFTARMKVAATAAAKQAISDAVEQLNTDYELEDSPWTMPDAVMIQMINAREPFIADAAKEIRDEVAGAVEDGITAGESAAQIATRIRQAFNAIDKDRALTIARTETAIAYGLSHIEGLRAKGFTHKEWLSARDEKTRLTHQHADGDVVPIDEPFEVGEARMMHPGDPTAPAKEIIRCRCCLMGARAPKA